MNDFRFNSDAVAAAKGLAILLMVAGHAKCPQYLQEYLGMIRMPVFFIMSGYCFKAKYLDDAATFVKKRVKGIWWPFVKWMLVFIVLHNVLFELNVYNDVFGYGGEVSSKYTWREMGVKCFKALFFCANEQLVGGYWFLKELFWGSLIGYGCIRCTRGIRGRLTSFGVQGGVVLMLLLVFAYIGKDVHIPGIFPNQRTWMATLFFLFGHAWREAEEGGTILSRYDGLPWWRQLPIVVVLGVGVKVIIILFGHTTMVSFTLRNALPYVVAALCGSVMVVYVCRWIVGRAWFLQRFLVFTGRHTFEVLTWHLSCFKLVSLLMIAIYGLSMEHLACFPVISTATLQAAGVDVEWTLWWWPYLIVGAGIPILWKVKSEKLKVKNEK